MLTPSIIAKRAECGIGVCSQELKPTSEKMGVGPFWQCLRTEMFLSAVLAIFLIAASFSLTTRREDASIAQVKLATGAKMLFVRMSDSVLAVGTLLLMFFTASFACAQKAPPSNDTCPSFSPVHHSQPIYQDLKAVNLYIDIPPNYQEAIECHGREEECVKVASGYGLPQFDTAKYIQRLKDTYNRYPKDLRPDVVRAFYSDRLKTQFAPLLPRDSSCQPRDPIVLDRHTVMAVDKSQNTLTLTVKVTIVETITPPLLILSTSYFRPDGHANYLKSLPFSTAFPLDLSESEITKHVADFEDRTAGRGPIRDYVREEQQ